MGRKSKATLEAEAAAKEAAEKAAADKAETGDDDVTDSNNDSSTSDQAGDQDSGGTGDSEGSETETPADGEDGSDQAEGDESSDQTDSEEQGQQEGTEAPVIASETVEGEDLGDVTDSPVKALRLNSIESGDVSEPDDEEEFQTIHDQIDADVSDDETPVEPPFQYELDPDFKPNLWPYKIKGEFVGYMQVPKVVFDLVQHTGWQKLIDAHPAKQGLKSVLYWRRRNGNLTVRCMSSSKFAEVVL